MCGFTSDFKLKSVSLSYFTAVNHDFLLTGLLQGEGQSFYRKPLIGQKYL